MRIDAGDGVRARCDWAIRQRASGTEDAWEQVAGGKNVLTIYGVTALASGLGGAYTPPLYLVIDNFYAVPTSVLNVGQTSITLSQAVHETGDTQIVLDAGAPNQETVTFTGTPVGATYTLTGAGCTKTHTTAAVCTRLPLNTDNAAQIQAEIQYDSVADPSHRAKSIGGFSGGTGNWTSQFFVTGSQAITMIAGVGLSDNQTVGQPNLHNHLVLGFNHTVNNDLIIDVSLTVVAS